jgi:hypothetical protein
MTHFLCLSARQWEILSANAALIEINTCKAHAYTLTMRSQREHRWPSHNRRERSIDTAKIVVVPSDKFWELYLQSNILV